MNLLATLQGAGLNASGYKSSQTHHTAGTFAPLGVMVHHTAAVGGAIVEICYSGRSGLPGPLCNIVARVDGTLVVTSNGRANDSGQGSHVVLDDVKASRAPSGDAAVRRLTDDISGNAYFYDIEIENAGDGTPYPIAQQRAVTQACAAICREMGWPASRVIAHREWTARKVDPRGLHMPTLRDAVASELSGDDMPLNADDQKWLDARFATVQGTVTTVQSNLAAEIHAVRDKVDKIAAGNVDLDALAEKVADVLAARLKD